MVPQGLSIKKPSGLSARFRFWLVLGSVALLLSAPNAYARDPGFAAQARCRGAAPCKGLKPHLNRLQKKLAALRGAPARKVRFILGSLTGLEAMRVGHNKLAAQAIETLKHIHRVCCTCYTKWYHKDHK